MRLPYLGLRRGWMINYPINLNGDIGCNGLFNQRTHPYHFSNTRIVFTFFSATQDIATDAYRTELLTAQERGMGTAMAVSGYRIAMLVQED